MKGSSGLCHDPRMTSSIKRLAVMALGAFLLSACAAPPPLRQFADITFANLTPLRLSVAAVAVSSDFRPAMAPPAVDHLFPVPPARALKRWAKDRLKAAGVKGRARFVIVDAAVREVPLKTRKGVEGIFYKEQSERYEAAVEARLEIIDAMGVVRATARARATRTQTVREDASINAREAVWFEMTEALMRDFNGEMEKNIRAYLSDWLM